MKLVNCTSSLKVRHFYPPLYMHVCVNFWLFFLFGENSWLCCLQKDTVTQVPKEILKFGLHMWSQMMITVLLLYLSEVVLTWTLRKLNLDGQLVHIIPFKFFFTSIHIYSRILIIIIFLNLLLFIKYENFQVNPSVYGDKQTRLFVYWTVSFWQSLKFTDWNLSSTKFAKLA